MQQRVDERGAVSLFVVIFAALLLTIVTVGFVQLMIKDQQQASVDDLSRSANDSALAGIEDAKRLLLLDQACREGVAASTVNCSAIANALAPEPGTNETSCDTLSRAGIVGENGGETIVQQSDSDGAARLDQAYTCVRIALNTNDYTGELQKDGSILVPLSGVGTFDTVELQWFSEKDISAGASVGFPSSGAGLDLPPEGAAWPSNNPPLLRAQLIQLGSGFKLADFDDSQPGNRSNTNTIFLYPALAGVPEKDFALDARRSPTNAPQLAECTDTLTETGYACRAVITLPNPIEGDAATRNAFLRLVSLYNSANFRITLTNGGSPVLFNRVLPEVDATGRANDVFRRIKARVELKGEFTRPEAAIDITGNLCKNFTVTDAEDGYSTSGTCTP
jgi:hypothetical protein